MNTHPSSVILHSLPRPSSFILHPFLRPAFTLVEIMVTITIMAIVLAAAVPVFSMLRGNRSVDGAQNLVAAALNEARTRAMAQGKSAGILFFMTADLRTNIVTVSEVNRINGYVLLEVPSDAEPIPLPANVGCQTLLDGIPDRYLGYDKFLYVNSVYTNPIGGVILFDGHGRITPLPYGFQMVVNPTGKLRILTSLAKILIGVQNSGVANSAPDWLIPTPVFKIDPPLSQLAVTLYNGDDFASLGYTRRDVVFTKDAVYSTGTSWPATPTDADDFGRRSEQDEEQWLDNNGRLLLINRYTGTLIKGD